MFQSQQVLKTAENRKVNSYTYNEHDKLGIKIAN